MFVYAVKLKLKLKLKKRPMSIVMFPRICCCSTNDSAIKEVTGRTIVLNGRWVQYPL